MLKIWVERAILLKIWVERSFLLKIWAEPAILLKSRVERAIMLIFGRYFDTRLFSQTTICQSIFPFRDFSF